MVEENDSAISVAVSIGREVELDRENEDKEEELPRWWELINIAVIHLSLVAMIDFEGIPATLKFTLDSIDMTLNLLSVLVVVIRIILELKIKGKLTKTAIADISITLIYLGGMIYEATIADDFNQFLEAETITVEILRAFKCFKLLLLFV